MHPFASAFDGGSILPPTCEWDFIDAEFQAMALDQVILGLVSRPESSNIRAHVRDAVEVARNPRVTDLDLRGYRSAEPGWILDRICCLSVATEIRRMILGCEPAFERVRTVLEIDPSASALLLRCPCAFAPGSQLLSFSRQRYFRSQWATPTGSQIMAIDARELTGSLGAPFQVIVLYSKARLTVVGGVPTSLRRDNSWRDNATAVSVSAHIDLS